MPFERELEVARDAARRAGELALSYQRQGVTAEEKDDESPVTIADREAEKLIVRLLTEAFPDDGLLGEEGAARVGVAPVAGHALLDWLILKLPVLWHRFWNAAAPDSLALARLSRFFFSALIDKAWGGEVRFSVPDHLRDLRSLA